MAFVRVTLKSLGVVMVFSVFILLVCSAVVDLLALEQIQPGIQSHKDCFTHHFYSFGTPFVSLLFC